MTERDMKKLEDMKKQYETAAMSRKQEERMKERISEAKLEKRRRKRKHRIRNMTAAAAVLAVLVILPNTSADVAYAMNQIPVLGKLVDVVTFRDYQYESERHHADIEVPELTVGGEELMNEDAQTQENLKKTAGEINAEIQKITDQIVAEFEKNMGDEEGYQDYIVKPEVINTTEEYFTLKLICYQGAGSGSEWDYFYTIDLSSGERLSLKDLFKENTDYITVISENIKKQMREQMAADENVYYWLEDEEVPEWNFQAITDETSFYLNENDEVVIAFNEGDVAPMYMGCVEFVIPSEVTADIRK